MGGTVSSVRVDADIYFPRDDGEPIAFRGPYMALIDPEALDISVLGRDLIAHFALIVDWSQRLVCLVNQRHGYRFITT